MKLNQVRWGRAAVGMLAAEAILIAGAIAWVAIYSYLINPGHPAAFYQDYANTAGPWVALILGVPVFFLICRRMGSRNTAMALFAIYFVIEVSFMIAVGAVPIAAWFPAINFPAKFIASYWGAGR